MPKFGSVMILVGLLGACSAPEPPHLSHGKAPLAACPDRPNCVSSLATDPRHAIAPLEYVGASPFAVHALKEVISAMPGGKVVEEQGDYLRAEFTTPRMRFVDDVEFMFDPAGERIQLRSASRVGYRDRGVNRARVETIRAELGPAILRAIGLLQAPEVAK